MIIFSYLFRGFGVSGFVFVSNFGSFVFRFYIVSIFSSFVVSNFIKMDQISIENMEFYAFHGHYHEEQIVGSKFLVNLTIEADLDKASVSDALKDTINYQAVYRVVKEEMETKSKLLESIAKRIIDSIYTHFEEIQKVTVKISKINPPIGGGRIEKVSVTLSR